MFCPQCGKPGIAAGQNFCGHCGAETKISSMKESQDPSIPSTSGLSPASLPDKKVKSFSYYKKLKSQQWTSATKKKQEKDTTVQIMIGVMEVNTKEMRLKPKRGKRLALHVSSKASYPELLEKAVEKWKAFNSDLYDEKEDYVLLFESGNEAKFLPGSGNEPFTLKRYKEELGRDFNKIVLYLCTQSDFHFDDSNESDDEDSLTRPAKMMKKNEDESEDDEDLTLPAIDIKKKEDANMERIDLTTESDEKFARKLQEEYDKEIGAELLSSASASDQSSASSQDKAATSIISSGKKNEFKQNKEGMSDCESVLRSIASKVDQNESFVLTVRRGVSLERVLTLWQRETKKVSPESLLRVRYCGESGIDTGAISQEFLANAITDIGQSMFPDGAPINSMLNVHNKNFQTSGQIVAVSLAQGGPPPSFFDESVYNLLINPSISMNSLEMDTHFTEKDRELLNSVLDNNFKDSNDFLTEVILENGYTGKIDNDHKEDIIGTMKVNIIAKRLVYLQQFAEGLELFNAFELIKSHKDLCKPLFVLGLRDVVDSNYIFSLVSPNYSEKGTSNRKVEEIVIDNFQDFLMTLEDDRVTGYKEPLAWNQSGDEDAESSKEEDHFASVDLTPPGVLGWLTGQRHRPVNGSRLYIAVNFNHNCLEDNPKHTICFPYVSACSKEVTLPVVHMKTPEEFKKVFLLAMCKGGSFARA